MRVRVLLFGRYAELLAAPDVAVEIADGATISDLTDALRQLPGGALLPPSPVVARNRAVGRPGDRVEATDELALLPPVAGG